MVPRVTPAASVGIPGRRGRRPAAAVWLARGPALDAPVDVLLASIPAAERPRHDTFLLASDRRMWRAANAMLYHQLGAATGVAPVDVSVVRAPGGRPELAVPGVPALRFNLSHARDLAACVLVSGRGCGVDVEPVAPFDGELAAHVCSPEERAALRRLRPRARARWFTTCWAAKEAFLKGLGMGLAVEPREVTVHLGPGRRVRISHPAAAGWRLHRLQVGPDHAGVLAVEGDVRVVVREWALPSSGGAAATSPGGW